MKRFMPSQVSMICVLFFGSAPGSAPVSGQAEYTPPEIILRAKVRDFKEKNPTDTVANHPHFNDQNACDAAELGIHTVQEDIDAAGPADGGTFPGDNRAPKLADSLGAMARCYDPAERFAEWYADKGPDTNRAFLVDLRFILDSATGIYHFQDNAFFPIDQGEPYAKFNPADPDPFGHLQTDTVDGAVLSRHNYGFTMELHTAFKYVEGAGQVLTFQGDDDIWVFMNGKRVLDFGGVHPTLSGEADLDSLKTILGLENGKTYPLDFFFAERHTASSSCRITTNLALNSAIPVVAVPVATPSGQAGGGFPVQVSLSTATPDARIYFTLDGSAPDSAKTLYTSALSIPEGTVVKAIAYRAGWIASPIMVEGYGANLAVRDPGRGFSAASPGPSEVAIFDRAGRLVRRVAGPGPRAAAGAQGWDRRDAHGRRAAPGVYFWRTGAGGGQPLRSGRVILP